MTNVTQHHEMSRFAHCHFEKSEKKGKLKKKFFFFSIHDVKIDMTAALQTCYDILMLIGIPSSLKQLLFLCSINLRVISFKGLSSQWAGVIILTITTLSNFNRF
jgi:hypothetical protein